MAIFALDVGEKRVGVATLDAETKIVQPIGVAAADDLVALQAILTCEEDVLVVVGLPINQRGEETAQSARVRQFAAQLQGRLAERVKLSFYGESATTKLALERLRAQGFDDQKLREARASGRVDMEAACIILEGWAEENL